MQVTGSRSLGWRCADDLIGTDDLYGTKEEVFGRDRKEKERFFFTELRRVGKGKNNLRICRNVGKGYWSNKGQRSWIRGPKGGIIGFKRGFRYQRKKGGGGQMNSDDWLLKEYLLAVKRGVKDKYANYALCVLKRKKKKNEKGSPTEDEISAAADIVVTDDWLRQELGDDDLIDDDDAPGDDDRAVPVVDCSMQEVDEWIVEDDRPLFEEECSVPVDPVEDSSSSAQLFNKSPVIESSPVDDEWLDGDVEEECSILAAAAAATATDPPSRDFDFDFGDYRCDQFAAWDVFCDPWAVGSQQMQMQMLPLVV